MTVRSLCLALALATTPLLAHAQGTDPAVGTPSGTDTNPKKARLIVDKDGYFTVSQVVAGFGGEKLSLDETSDTGLRLSGPQFSVRAQVTLSPKITGRWKIGWILLLQDKYQSYRWGDQRRDLRAAELPLNLGGPAGPWFASGQAPLADVIAGAPLAVSFHFPWQEVIAWTRSDSAGRAHPLDTVLLENTYQLYLTAWNEAQNVFVLLQAINFTEGWEIAVDSKAARGAQTKISQSLFPAAEVKPAASLKAFAPDLLFPAAPAALSQTWDNGVLQTNKEKQ